MKDIKYTFLYCVSSVKTFVSATNRSRSRLIHKVNTILRKNQLQNGIDKERDDKIR